MNKKQVQDLHNWFNTLVRSSLGAQGDGKERIKLSEVDDWSYGFHAHTKYGLLTFNLDAISGRNESINVMAKFLELDKIPGNQQRPMRHIPINSVDMNEYTGKWNLHLGVISPDRAKPIIELMFRDLI